MIHCWCNLKDGRFYGSFQYLEHHILSLSCGLFIRNQIQPPDTHRGSVSLHEQKFALLIVKEADHVVFEGIAALIVAEFLLVPHVNGLHS